MNVHQRGSALPLVIMGMALVGVFMLSMSRVVKDSMSFQKLIEYRIAAQHFRYLLLNQLSDPAVCALNFGGTAAAGAVNPVANDPDPDFIVSSNGERLAEEFSISQQAYGMGVLRVDEIRFDTNRGFAPTFVGSSRGAAYVQVSLNTGLLETGFALGRSFRPIPLVVEVDAGGRIQSCQAVGDDLEGAWRLSPAGHIYFPDPVATNLRVGIGTSVPAANLHVVGGLSSVATATEPSHIMVRNAPGDATDTGTLNATAPGDQGFIHVNDLLAENFMHFSDQGLKEQIQPLQVTASDFDLVRGVKFLWKDRPEEVKWGVLAQDIQKLSSSLVQASSINQSLMIDSGGLMAYLVEALKTQAALNRQLQSQIEEQDERIQRLLQRVRGLEESHE